MNDSAERAAEGPAGPASPAAEARGADELRAAAKLLADRFRSMPQSRLLGAVPGHPSRAAAGLALARELARLAHAPVELPDAGPFAVGDQIAVAGHDLACEDLGADHPAAIARGIELIRATTRICG
jgi:hypothetical protein